MREELRELENAKGSEHESIFTFKMTFLECFQTVFFLPQAEQSRALFCLEDKGVTQSILENFGFHNEYDDEYKKVLIISWTLQTNSAILHMLNGCSILIARKLLQSVINEPDELKL